MRTSGTWRDSLTYTTSRDATDDPAGYPVAVEAAGLQATSSPLTVQRSTKPVMGSRFNRSDGAVMGKMWASA